VTQEQEFEGRSTGQRYVYVERLKDGHGGFLNVWQTTLGRNLVVGDEVCLIQS
jgi:hypothetical protein